MKRLIVLFLAACLTVGLAACGDEHEGTTTDPSAPVAQEDDQVTVYLLRAETDYLADGTPGPRSVTCDYDDAGKLIGWQIRREQTEEGLSGDTAYGYTYAYDQEGRLARCVMTVLEAEQEPQVHQLRYRYDENGRLWQIVPGEDHAPILELGYDDQGTLVSAVEQGEDRSIRCLYTYDLAGQLIQVDYQTGGEEQDFALQIRAEFDYDDKGRVLCRSQYAPDDTLSGSVVCTYDSFGARTSVCYFAADGNLLDSFHYTYSLSGEATCRWTRKVGEEEGLVQELNYDKNGNLVRRTYEDGSYTVYTYQALELTQDQARRYRQYRHLVAGTEPNSIWNTQLGDSAGFGYYALAPLPSAPLRETDLLRSGEEG